MACKSLQKSPSSPRIWKYDVFLSFRGDDTRCNFTDHLYAALHRKAIITFKDDIKLKKGETISKELFKAIEESRICIVVFSKNYASSTWCLEELAKIAHCTEHQKQSVLPVFYDLDPSDVRKHTGNYGRAFDRYQETFTNIDKVQRWKEALSKMANLSGWDVRNKQESEVIEDIVKVTISILGHKFSNLAKEYVGLDSRLETLSMHLALGSNDVRYVGIVGMGGIGKTTLASCLYDRICHYFDGCSFLDNVNKASVGDGLIHLQEQLLCETLNENDVKIWSVHRGTNLISTRMHHIKALIVLDNVDQSDQLEKLAGMPDWFGAGSRIIITTRDEHILKKHGVDEVHRVKLLNEDEDLQLFCRKAFKCDYPLKDYERMTSRVLEYAKGLPLATKVLGSFLFDRNISEWESALARLQENPNKEIMDVLRTSFEGLEETEKEIFLDIACFYAGSFEIRVKAVLDYCGLHPDIGMRVLIEKSLITIVESKIQMHDLLQELGRKIVMEKSPKEPGKWSRLWSPEHLHHITMRNVGTEDVEAIVLSGPCPEERTLEAQILSKMNRLRILELYDVKISGKVIHLPNGLRCLSWHNYPYTVFPYPFSRWTSMLQLDRLVELFMPGSSFKQLWQGIKPLYNLRIMDLTDSLNLIKTPDFRGFPNLKHLELEGCTSLSHVDQSIGVLSKLEYLNLENCTSLVSLPSSIFRLTSLQGLGLSFCSKLNNPLGKTMDAECLEKFDIEKSTSAIVRETVISPFQFFSRRCEEQIDLLLRALQSLQVLNLDYCNLQVVPRAIGLLHSLEVLRLAGNNFVTLPLTINNLPRLAHLSLGYCKELQSLPELTLSTKRDFSAAKLAPHRPSCPICASGLFIFNCPKLVEIQNSYSRFALSWLTTLAQEPHHQEGRLDFVIPGSRIPEWFNHQNLGRSTRVQLPQSRDWIGVAICAALVPNGYDIKTDYTAWGTYYYTSFTVELCSEKNVIRIRTPQGVMRMLVRVESVHLWLFYLPREMSICTTLLTWQVGNDVVFTASGKDIKVTRCGVRWVYKQDIQDLELLNAAMNNC